MIILDTNVLSELMRPRPNPTVAAWVASQQRHDLLTTRVTEAEIFLGIAVLPMGRRRDTLQAVAEGLFAEEFAGRVLSLDGTSSRRYGEIVAARRSAGRPIAGFDALIAAIAWAKGASVATRDTDAFAGCEIKVINPWTAGGQ